MEKKSMRFLKNLIMFQLPQVR